MVRAGSTGQLVRAGSTGQMVRAGSTGQLVRAGIVGSGTVSMLLGIIGHLSVTLLN